jgi:phenylacetate-CoA ligase
MSDREADPLAIAEYTPFSSVALTDEERWPQLGREAALRLAGILDHAHAPAWVHRAGHRLDEQAVARLAEPAPLEAWLESTLAVAAQLPAYRGYPHPLKTLDDFPLISRDDLVADVAGFVPRGSDLSRLVAGTSSGSTGNPLHLPDHVEDVARTFVMLRDLVREAGVRWEPDSSRLGLAYIVNQRQVFTYASAIPGFGDSVMARVNLGDRAWTDRDEFLADVDPQVFSGSPTSLAVLLEPQLVERLRPLALVSGAMHLSATLRSQLEAAYSCPVIDIYGLHETRPIAASLDGGPLVVLNRRVLVECLDPSGRPVGAGERGELVVTAGENPLLPLVRYRTGDFGRLTTVNGRTAIAELEGREDVTFAGVTGQAVPSVDVTQQLQAAGALGWTLVQHPDLSVRVVIAGGDAAQAEHQLRLLLGDVTVTRVDRLDELGEGKPRRYRRLFADG